MMVKRNSPTYVLDTNVLLSFPRAIYSFQDCAVVLPITTLEELDSKKSGHTELAANARAVIRMLSGLGDLTEGAKLENGVVVKVHPEVAVKDGMKDTPDNRILACCTAVKGIMVSNDLNVRVKAMGMGLKTQEFSADSKDEEQYTGIAEFEVASDVVTQFNSSQVLLSEELGVSVNEFVVLRDEKDPGRVAVGRARKDGQVHVIDHNPRVSGFGARNMEQAMLLDLLLDDDIRCVCVSGIAGSGKTLLSLAVGLHKVWQEGRYTKLAIYKPISTIGEDIGYLPGTAQEKLEPMLGNFFDNLEQILGNSRKTKGGKPVTKEDLIDQGILIIEPVAYMRGRSIVNQFIILDEAQNLSQTEIRSIVSRAGENSKLIILGDSSQIDKKGLDKWNCGISHAMNKLKGHDIVGCLALQKGERSALASLAAEVL
jgi:PhoH-like ATPase